MTADTTDRHPATNIDRLLVQSLARWGFIIAALVILFAVLVMLGYPFPDSLDGARGVAYTIAAIGLLLAVIWMTFLGYRVVTMRVATSRQQVYPIFLPVTALVASVVGFLLMSAPK